MLEAPSEGNILYRPETTCFFRKVPQIAFAFDPFDAFLSSVPYREEFSCGSLTMFRTASRLSIRSYSTNGKYILPAVKGEPFLHYPPGSPERALLEAELKKVRNEVVEIPVVINGKEHWTGDTFVQTMPSDHRHTLAKIHRATPQLMDEATNVALKARKEWAMMPFEHRAMIFRKAADLIAGKYRSRMNAATMLGTGKTVWQAEIDSAVETVDFLRQNTVYAQEIYSVQPALNSPNTWNRLEYRELEVVSHEPAYPHDIVRSPSLLLITLIRRALSSLFRRSTSAQLGPICPRRQP